MHKAHTHTHIHTCTEVPTYLNRRGGNLAIVQSIRTQTHTKTGSQAGMTDKWEWQLLKGEMCLVNQGMLSNNLSDYSGKDRLHKRDSGYDPHYQWNAGGTYHTCNKHTTNMQTHTRFVCKTNNNKHLLTGWWKDMPHITTANIHTTSKKAFLRGKAYHLGSPRKTHSTGIY